MNDSVVVDLSGFFNPDICMIKVCPEFKILFVKFDTFIKFQASNTEIMGFERLAELTLNASVY